MCGLQFTVSHHRQVEKRPSCPACGNHMHLYKEEKTLLRFRCSQYPVCKTYARVLKPGALSRMKRKKEI
jgi:ssDNA-binding Zn-finger/Zn-ribbon topoisomerase 1